MSLICCFIHTHTDVASAVLGAVFLAVTGGEALYADLGQFGRRPIARPRVPIEERVKLTNIAADVFHVDVSNGYLQPIDLPALITPVLHEHGVSPATVSYVVSLHRPVIATGG